jgi:hypothetical protein
MIYNRDNEYCACYLDVIYHLCMKKFDLIILATIFLISIVFMVSMSQLRNPLIDTTIILYETYFVIPTFHFWLITVSILGFITFLIRQLITRFHRTTGSIVLIFSTSTLLALIPEFELLYWVFRIIMNSGWHTEIPNNDETFNPAFLVVRTVLISTLVSTTFKLGQLRK